MKRRDFIKIIGAGTASAVILPSALTGCSNEPSPALTPWLGRPDETDIRLKVIAYGLLAANPHNIQPWLIRLETANSFSLFVDPERLLPETDPVHRQIHIGQGTFIENLMIAARQFGHAPHLEWFPDGEYGPDELDNLPVARVTLQSTPDLKKDPLFDQLTRRQSTKREYDSTPIPPSLLTRLAGSLDGLSDLSDFKLHWFSNETDRRQMTYFIGEAMAVEVSDHERHLETWRLFRFNDSEIEQFRDGFGYASNGVSGLRRLFIQQLYSRQKAKPLDSSWAQFPIQQHYDLAASAPVFGCLSSARNTRLDQVHCGRLYERLNLQASALGLAIHPHSQILQEYSDMQPLQEQFKQTFSIPSEHTVQMLYRIGYADPVARTPRRELSDLLLPG